MTTSERPGAGRSTTPEDGTFVPPTARRTRRRRRPTGAPPPLPRSIGIVGHRLARRLRRARRLDRRHAAVGTRTAGHRPGRCRDPAGVRPSSASSWLSECAAGRRSGRHGLDDVRGRRCVLVGRDDRLPPLAPPVHVPRRRARARARRGRADRARTRGPRPYDVTIIGRWQGYSLPSATLGDRRLHRRRRRSTPWSCPGRPRTIAKAVGAAIVGLVAFARLYLGVDHPFDVAHRHRLRCRASRLLAFRFFTPNELFPVTYRQGKTAHLDVGGRRGEAIRRAVEDQLGVTVVEITPVGLAGSGGSTPLRLRVAGEPDTYLFGKLYAMNHVRADRWYKLGRTILYGRLEDERPFQSVRRLVQHEDYAMRLLCDVGHPDRAADGHRRADARARVPDGHRVLRRRRRDRRRRGRRPDHRRGAGADPPALGRRHRPPRHQAGQPARAGRAPRTSSTWPSSRSARRRGGRRSTSPT